MEIKASVGENGANHASDVQLVQELLNAVPPERGGADPELKVDGVCGPKTKTAILKFQRQNLGGDRADGRIDPKHPTLAKLNELADPLHTGLLAALEEFVEDARKHRITLSSLEHGQGSWSHTALQFQKALFSYEQARKKRRNA